ncbi:MAG: hypothetical protein FWD47_12270 [Treponema sp.]|nr:hypothetical protein [Treponema sp.]
MDKQEALELLGYAMGYIVSEAEIEAQIAKDNGISRKELDKKHINGDEMPDCIKQFRKIDQQRKKYAEKLLKHELRVKGELLEKTVLAVVLYLYPKFENDYLIMKDNEYFFETENGLTWNKSDKLLAEYFGNQVDKDENIRWAEIESLFNKKGLKSSYRNAKIKSANGYDELVNLLKNDLPKGK